MLDAHDLPRAIATNSVTSRAEWKLSLAGLLNRVDGIVGLDQVKAGKPEPFVYEEAVRRLNLVPENCAALDDTDIGVRAALSARISTVIQVSDLIASDDLLAHHQAVSLNEAAEIFGLLTS